MKHSFTTYFNILVLILVGGQSIGAQGVRGKITDQLGAPVPYANIFIEELGSGTASDDQGVYFLTLPNKGDYRLICSAIGYETFIDTIIVEEEIIVRDFLMKTAAAELEEIVVSASKKDPAYVIMRKVIDRKKEYLKSVGSYRAQVYIKAREDIKTVEKAKKKKGKKKDNKTPGIENGEAVDPFAAQEKANQELMAQLNMLEVELQLNYQYPKKYKEERTAYKLYGSKDGLFVPTFGDADLNFYRNQVDFAEMTEVNIISPLSTTAILSYKYKLEETTIEGSQTVYKIKVTPRKIGNATCRGTIYINAGLWNINRLDFKLPKGNLRFFDQLEIQQTYEPINDSLWLPMRQAFVYQTKEGKRKKFDGQTTIRFQDVEVDYPFPPKFFGNEISITTAEAYKRDTSYWQEARVEPLTSKEKKVVSLRDSIESVMSSKEYKDSIDANYNKITFQDVFLDGIGFRNHEKQRQLYFGSLPSLLDFEVINGLRLGPYINYFKRWDNGVIFSGYGNVNIGLRELDVQGAGYLRLRYAPLRQADFWINGGRTYNSINNFEAYLNQLRRNNYILTDAANLGHRIELVNGLYFTSVFGFADRNPVDTEGTETFLDQIITDVPPIDFEAYQTFFTDITLSYTPKQKYLTEPNRKVVLGSKWPTFSVNFKKGWNKIFSSDVNFDYLEFKIAQNVEFGALGQTNYQVQVGDFTNTANLRFIDLKRFRESDPLLYSEALEAFQSLDTSLTTTNLFVEFHHLHHFNGALINNIPLIKKTNIRVVAGGGMLWVKENNFRHAEVVAGIERVFKLGARRRLRLGVYGVLANSNVAKGDANFKVSIDIIDTWKKDWSF